MKFKSAKRLAIVSLMLIAAVGFIATYWLWIMIRWEKPYARIKPEDTEACVISLLGKPTAVYSVHCWFDQSSTQEPDFRIGHRLIVKHFRYEVPSATNNEYIIGFDSNGHAVVKLCYEDPESSLITQLR